MEQNFENVEYMKASMAMIASDKNMAYGAEEEVSRGFETCHKLVSFDERSGIPYFFPIHAPETVQVKKKPMLEKDIY